MFGSRIQNLKKLSSDPVLACTQFPQQLNLNNNKSKIKVIQKLRVNLEGRILIRVIFRLKNPSFFALLLGPDPGHLYPAPQPWLRLPVTQMACICGFPTATGHSTANCGGSSANLQLPVMRTAAPTPHPRLSYTGS